MGLTLASLKCRRCCRSGAGVSEIQHQEASSTRAGDLQSGSHCCYGKDLWPLGWTVLLEHKADTERWVQFSPSALHPPSAPSWADAGGAEMWFQGPSRSSTRRGEKGGILAMRTWRLRHVPQVSALVNQAHSTLRLLQKINFYWHALGASLVVQW